MSQNEKSTKPSQLDYRSLQNTTALPSVVNVEWTKVGAVVVGAALPPKTFQKVVIGGAVGAAMVSAMVIGFAVFGLTMRQTIPAQNWAQKALEILFPLIPAALVIPILIRSALRLRRSYIFEADRDGITIRSYLGRREWCERLPIDQISDVRIGFSRGGKGPSSAWLIIAVKPWYQFNRRLLNDYGGDNLARIADALRAGIQLPARSWP